MFIKNEELIKEFKRECEKFKEAKGELNIGFLTGLFTKLLAKSQQNLDDLKVSAENEPSYCHWHNQCKFPKCNCKYS